MKITEIEKTLTRIEENDALRPGDSELLKRCADSTDACIRSRVAQVLVHFAEPEAEELLLRLASDSDELVRTEAYDSLCVFHSPSVIAALNRAVKDEKDDLARSYAILSYAEALDKTEQPIPFFRDLLAKESSEHCRLSLYYGLYIWGVENALQDMAAFLQNEDYHLRCAAVSLLSDALNKENAEELKREITALERVEQTIAVKDSIDYFWEAAASKGHF